MRARRTAMMLTDVECGGVRLLLVVLVMCREAVLLGNSGGTKGNALASVGLVFRSPLKTESPLIIINTSRRKVYQGKSILQAVTSDRAGNHELGVASGM